MPPLTANQARVLHALATQEYPTVREIADTARLPQATVRAVLLALVAEGLAVAAGTASTGGRCYSTTSAGLAALRA